MREEKHITASIVVYQDAPAQLPTLIAAFLVQLLYGLNFTYAKDVMAGGYMKPFGFILLRVAGATALFWLFSFLGPREKIERKDYLTFL